MIVIHLKQLIVSDWLTANCACSEPNAFKNVAKIYQKISNNFLFKRSEAKREAICGLLRK
jgi:hypothetical protein